MSGVDVLAVMETVANRLQVEANKCGAHGSIYADGLYEARAAVAELIEAVKETLYSHPVARTYSDGPCIERSQRDELKAILARVTGGSA